MNRHVVVRTIDRADQSVIDELGAAGTSTVHEAIGRVGYVGPHIAPIQRDRRIAGSAVTVLSHPGDNIMIHAAVEVCRPGDVLVVVNTAPSTHGMFGELLATSFVAHGLRALVIDAGVRERDRTTHGQALAGSAVQTGVNARPWRGARSPRCGRARPPRRAAAKGRTAGCTRG